MDSDERSSDPRFQIELGWNTSPPHFQFPDSDREVDSLDDSQIHPRGSSVEHPPPALMLRSSNNHESLGKYSSLLPGSSPPRPPLKARKRRDLSPRQRDIKQAKHEDNSSMDSERRSFDSELAIGSDFSIELAPKVLVSEKENKVQEKQREEPPKKVHSISDAELALLEDLDDIEDMFAQRPVSFKESFFSNRKVRRFTVLETVKNPSNVLVTCLNAENERRVIELRGSWTESAIFPGDVVHLANNKPSDLLTVDSNATSENQLLLIVNPDVLIPCTTVAQAMSCERQVILNTQVRAPSDLNENLVLGSIKHEFIQSCFTAGTGGSFATEVMTTELRQACEAYALDLRLVDSDVESAFAKLQKIIPEIQKWADKFWGKVSRGVQLESLKIRINRAVQVEEEIRSPHLGLVGKIDVTCEVSLLDDQSSTNRLTGLEIKTGKFTQSVGHRAQTALYTLLLAERHPNNTHPWSLLYYTETGETLAVTLRHQEIAALIQRRNMVATNLWNAPGRELPAPVSATDMSCKWCSRKDSCVLYTAIDDEGNTHGSAALAGVYQAAQEAGKMTPQFLQFIQKWHHLLDLEHDLNSKTDRLQARQWWISNTQPTLWKVNKKLENDNPLAVGHYYSLVPASNDTPEIPETLSESTVLLSSKQHMALNFGLVVSANAAEIRVALREELPGFGKYRIDIDPWTSDANLGLARFNLNNLLNADRLRELIVDLVPPQWYLFNSKTIESTIERASNRVLHSQSTSSENSSVTTKMAVDHSNLNSDQSEALNKVLNARDYALILGMPGTGKTTTIAAIVASLVERGKTVLVSAYTNSAVDTIVRKLLDAQQNCMRLVSSNYDTSAMTPEVAAASVSMSGDASNSRLVDFLSAPVVACTSHGTNNKIFALRDFDYCILDEASQITLPFVLGPLRLASTFVLVGDHYQLPPLVRNQQARALGMDQSLFKILCESHPDAVVALRKQYRMCQDIMSLSSDLVYEGKLIAGNEAVANQQLEIRGWSFVNPKSPLHDALNPANSVVFLDTDVVGVRAHEKQHDDGSSNPGEAKIIFNLVTMLAELGVSMNNCAVISVYRHQLALLSSLLQDQVSKGLEILTADQAQGRDKNCIIVSLVKSNEYARTGELLKDWRRLNVAFTRAKQKLVIVGSRRTMQQADGVARFFNYIESRGWVHPASLST